jgi:cytochrome c-type biogenesis protein CcmH
MSDTVEVAGAASADEQAAPGAGADVRESFLRRWGPWLAMAVIVTVALVYGTVGSTGPQTNEQRVLAIAQTLRCPVCDGESVAESDSDASVQIRQEIAKRLDEGWTPDQIRTYLASPDRYGPQILLTPSGSGVSSLVWIIPVIALVVAFAVLFVVFRRWRSTASLHASDKDRALVTRALEEDP